MADDDLDLGTLLELGDHGNGVELVGLGDLVQDLGGRTMVRLGYGTTAIMILLRHRKENTYLNARARHQDALPPALIDFPRPPAPNPLNHIKLFELYYQVLIWLHCLVS